MKNKKELFCITFISVIIILLCFFYYFPNKNDDIAFAVIEVNGQIVDSVPLNIDAIIDIDGTNILEIKDNDALMVFATCQDQLCTQQGYLSRGLQMIICLPNQVLIRVEGDLNSSVDVVS